VSSIFQTAAGGLWAEASVGARLDYSFDWQFGADPIQASVWTVLPAAAGAPSIATAVIGADGRTTAMINCGTAEASFTVTNTVTTAAGRTDSQSFALLIQSGIAAQTTSTLFPSPRDAVATVRRKHLSRLAASLLAGAEISDGDIWSKLKAAEAEVERVLRVYLSPVEVLPSDPDYDAQAATYASQGRRVLREPGYDFTPEMFHGNRWGLLELRQRPITAIRFARFSYPSQTGNSIDLPTQWLRPEGRTNRVSIVPVDNLALAPLNSMMLSAMAGASTIPFMLQIGYQCGLDNARDRLPDLAAVVERMAMLSIVEDQLLPQSGSISADGLSRSLSWDASKHQDEIDAKLARMRDGLQGIRMIVA